MVWGWESTLSMIPAGTISVSPRGVCWRGPLRTSTTRRTWSCFGSSRFLCSVLWRRASGVGGAVGGVMSWAVSGSGAGMGTVAEERKEEGETQWGRARAASGCGVQGWVRRWRRSAKRRAKRSGGGQGRGGGGDPGGADIFCSCSDARRSLLGRYHRVLHPAMSGSSGALIQ